YTDHFTLTKSVTINGTAGAASTTIDAHQVGPANVAAVIVNGAGISVAINGLTIKGGFANFGAGLQVDNGAVVVSDSVITANKAATTSPAASGGGGIGVLGTFLGPTSLVLNRVTVSANSTTASGGGIYAAGPVSINDSTITGNV